MRDALRNAKNVRAESRSHRHRSIASPRRRIFQRYISPANTRRKSGEASGTKISLFLFFRTQTRDTKLRLPTHKKAQARPPSAAEEPNRNFRISFSSFAARAPSSLPPFFWFRHFFRQSTDKPTSEHIRRTRSKAFVFDLQPPNRSNSNTLVFGFKKTAKIAARFSAYSTQRFTKRGTLLVRRPRSKKECAPHFGRGI